MGENIAPGSASGKQQLGDVLARKMNRTALDSAQLRSHADYSAAGYTRLVPIVPPDAELSPESALSKNPSSRGKAVGVRGDDGKWRGFNWATLEEAAPDEMKRWAKMGAGVGVKTGPIDPTNPDGEWLVFIDADVTHNDYARVVLETVERHFGVLPVRIGKYPKALYPLRVSSGVNYMRVSFGEVDAQTRRPAHHVELLAGMKQAVMPPSIHPVTRKPYYWAKPLVPLHKLPCVAPEALTAFFDDLRGRLPNATGDRLDPTPAGERRKSKEALRGELEEVRRLVEAMPNTIAAFPTYDDMIHVGQAIKGALPDDPDEGFALFDSWFSRFEGGGYDPCLSQKYWRTLGESHSLGAGTLRSLARQHAHDKYLRPEDWFDVIGDDPREAEKRNLQSVFQTPDKRTSSPARQLKTLSLDEAATLALTACAKPLVRGVLDCGAMSVVYGAPGAGKTFVMLDLAFCIAAGRAWAGRAVTQGVVVYIAAEGKGKILARVKALCDRYGAADTEGFPIPLRILPERVNLRDARADLEPLLTELRAVERAFGKIVLTVIDTLSRALAGGDENSPVDMGAFVANVDTIRDTMQTHTAIVHHTGKDASKGMRGHSVLLGAIDTELEVADGVIASDKQRDNASDTRVGFKLRSVHVGLDDQGEAVTTAVVDLLSADEAQAAALEAKSARRGAGRGGAKREHAVGAILDALGDMKREYRFQSKADAIGAALRKIGEINGTSSKSVLRCLKALEKSGAFVEVGGQKVRMKLRKDAGANNADLFIVFETFAPATAPVGHSARSTEA